MELCTNQLYCASGCHGSKSDAGGEVEDVGSDGGGGRKKMCYWRFGLWRGGVRRGGGEAEVGGGLLYGDG